MRTCGSRSSLGVRSRAVGGSVGQISHIAGPHPLSLGVRRYPLFPLGEKQTFTQRVPAAQCELQRTSPVASQPLDMHI